MYVGFVRFSKKILSTEASWSIEKKIILGTKMVYLILLYIFIFFKKTKRIINMKEIYNFWNIEDVVFLFLPLLLWIQTFRTSLSTPTSLQNSLTYLSSQPLIFQPALSAKALIITFCFTVNFVLLRFLSTSVLILPMSWSEGPEKPELLRERSKCCVDAAGYSGGGGGGELVRWLKTLEGSRRWKLRWQPHASQLRDGGSVRMVVDLGMNSPQPSRA